MSIQPWKTKYVIGHLLQWLTRDHLEAWQTDPLTYKTVPNSLSWDILESDSEWALLPGMFTHKRNFIFVTEAQQCSFIFCIQKNFDLSH